MAEARPVVEPSTIVGNTAMREVECLEIGPGDQSYRSSVLMLTPITVRDCTDFMR